MGRYISLFFEEVIIHQGPTPDVGLTNPVANGTVDNKPGFGGSCFLMHVLVQK